MNAKRPAPIEWRGDPIARRQEDLKEAREEDDVEVVEELLETRIRPGPPLPKIDGVRFPDRERFEVQKAMEDAVVEIATYHGFTDCKKSAVAHLSSAMANYMEDFCNHIRMNRYYVAQSTKICNYFYAAVITLLRTWRFTLKPRRGLKGLLEWYEETYIKRMIRAERSARAWVEWMHKGRGVVPFVEPVFEEEPKVEVQRIEIDQEGVDEEDLVDDTGDEEKEQDWIDLLMGKEFQDRDEEELIVDVVGDAREHRQNDAQLSFQESKFFESFENGEEAEDEDEYFSLSDEEMSSGEDPDEAADRRGELRRVETQQRLLDEANAQRDRDSVRMANGDLTNAEMMELMQQMQETAASGGDITPFVQAFPWIAETMMRLAAARAAADGPADQAALGGGDGNRRHQGRAEVSRGGNIVEVEDDLYDDDDNFYDDDEDEEEESDDGELLRDIRNAEILPLPASYHEQQYMINDVGMMSEADNVVEEEYEDEDVDEDVSEDEVSGDYPMEGDNEEEQEEPSQR